MVGGVVIAQYGNVCGRIGGEGGGVSKFIVIGKWLNYSGIRIAVGGIRCSLLRPIV